MNKGILFNLLRSVCLFYYYFYFLRFFSLLENNNENVLTIGDFIFFIMLSI